MELEEIFYISEKNWYKLQAWAKLAYDKDKNEISGLMTALPQEDGRIEIGNVEILKQENTGTNTDLDGEAVAAYTMKYAMKYNNPDMKFVWWHSHHTMGAFWSGTDENEINAWKNNSYSLALVINLKEEYLFRISFWKTNNLPMEQHIDTTLTIERPQPKVNITKSMEKQYEELCSNRVATVVKYGGYTSYNGWGRTNPNQSNLWSANNEKALEIEKFYSQALEKAEIIQDGVVDGTVTMKEYKKQVKEANKKIKEKNLPFKLKIIQGNSHEVMSKMMTLMTSDLFEWDDNRLKDEIETMNWNNSFGGGWYGH